MGFNSGFKELKWWQT